MRHPRILLLLLATTILVACHPTQTSSTHDSTLPYTDDYGNVVDVPTHPSRIVSVSPAITEIMYALGSDSLLVGRTDFCRFPAECKDIESIGGISNLNIEKVLSLNPDLVLCGSMIPQSTIETMLSLHLPTVCIIEQTRFDSLYSNIQKIGRLTSFEHEADSLNAVLRRRVASVVASYDTAMPKRPKIYYVVGFGEGGNFTAGGNTFINDIICMAGGRNVAESVTGWSISLEALFSADPDFIIIRSEDCETFCKTPPYNKLRAVKEGNLIAMDDGMLDLQVPRNIDAIERIHRAIYP